MSVGKNKNDKAKSFGQHGGHKDKLDMNKELNNLTLNVFSNATNNDEKIRSDQIMI